VNELNHGAGKGDKDRSPGWRRNYAEIRWGISDAGFVRVGHGRMFKRYGGAAKQPEPPDEFMMIL